MNQVMEKYRQAILHLLLVAALTFSVVLAAPGTARADIPETALDSNVMANLDSYFPNVSNAYPYNADPTSIGIDELFGFDKALVRYMGEVPTSLKDTDGWKNYRYFASDPWGNYGGQKAWRSWGKIQQGATWPAGSDVTYTDIAALEDTDLHIKALTIDNNVVKNVLEAAGSAVFMTIGSLNFLVGQAVNILIVISNVDIQGILDAWSGGSANLGTRISSLFTISPDGKTISPLFTIALAVFIFSLAGMMLRVVRGGSAARELAQEFIFLFLAMFICFGTMNGTASQAISKGSVELSTYLISKINSDNNEFFPLYQYSTNNPSEDVIHTQMAMTKKPFVDLKIYMQMGLYPSELSLTPEDWYQANVNDAIAAITDKGGTQEDSPLTVYNSKNRTNPCNNLGYYFLAADSSVDNYNPIGDNGSINQGTNTRVALVVDFLQALKAQNPDNAQLQTKVETIWNNLVAPNAANGMGAMLLMVVQNVSLLMCCGAAVAFCLWGKVVVVLGSFFMPILSLLLLVKKLRRTAKQVLVTYAMCFLRFLVGLIFVNLAIGINCIMSEGGMTGMVVAIGMNITLFLMSPKIFEELNALCSKGDQLGAAQSLNAAFGNRARRVAQRRSARYQSVFRNGGSGSAEMAAAGAGAGAATGFAAGTSASLNGGIRGVYGAGSGLAAGVDDIDIPETLMTVEEKQRLQELQDKQANWTDQDEQLYHELKDKWGNGVATQDEQNLLMEMRDRRFTGEDADEMGKLKRLAKLDADQQQAKNALTNLREDQDDALAYAAHSQITPEQWKQMDQNQKKDFMKQNLGLTDDQLKRMEELQYLKDQGMATSQERAELRDLQEQKRVSDDMLDDTHQKDRKGNDKKSHLDREVEKMDAQMQRAARGQALTNAVEDAKDSYAEVRETRAGRVVTAPVEAARKIGRIGKKAAKAAVDSTVIAEDARRSGVTGAATSAKAKAKQAVGARYSTPGVRAGEMDVSGLSAKEKRKAMRSNAAVRGQSAVREAAASAASERIGQQAGAIVEGSEARAAEADRIRKGKPAEAGSSGSVIGTAGSSQQKPRLNLGNKKKQ